MMLLLKDCLLALVLYSALTFVDAVQTNSTPVSYFPPSENGGSQFVEDILGDQGKEPLNVRL